MKNDLMTFVKKYESMITAIALFTALAAFFASFVKSPSESTLSDKFIPFISVLIVITLLFYLYLKSREVLKPERIFYVFKYLLLSLLFFSIIYIFEFWPNFIQMILKLVILLVIIYLFMILFDKSIKNDWFIKYNAWMMLGYFFATFIILLIIGTPNCNLNSYIQFALFSMVFSLTLFIVMMLTHYAVKIWEIFKDLFTKKKNESKRKPIILTLVLIIIVVSIAVLIANYLLPKYMPLTWLANFLIKILLIPRKIACGF